VCWLTQENAKIAEKKLIFVKKMCKSAGASGIEGVVARRGTSHVAPH